MCVDNTRKMKDSGVAWIGTVPLNWEIYRNKDAFTCNKILVGEESKTIQLLSLTTKGIKKKDIHNAEGKLPESFDTYQKVKSNDLVMCLFDLDVSAVFSGLSPMEGMISPAYRVLTCTHRVHPLYADYWFQYIGHGRKFNHYAKNIRYTLSYEDFAGLPMLFPPIDEQKRIADYLDDKAAKIDAAIAKQEQVIEKISEYKDAIISEEIEIHRSYNRIKWIKDRLTVGVVVRPAEYFDDNGTIPFLRGINVSEYVISPEPMVYITPETNEKLQKTKIYKNDILIVRDGKIGVSCVVTDEYDGANVVSMIILSVGKGYNPHYICYALNSLWGRQQFDLSKIGSALTHTSVEAVSNITLPIPSLDEQSRIVSRLNYKLLGLNNHMRTRQRLIKKLTEYKKSLIYEAVTGKKEI